MTRIINHSSPSIDLDDIKRVTKIMKSNFIAYGTENKKLIEYFKKNKTLPCGTGNQAIMIALRSLTELSPKKKVLISNYSCPSILSVIRFLNLIPVIVDTDNNYLISIKKIKKIVLKDENGILAIIIPHIFGLKFSFTKLDKLKIPIIEDFAHVIPKEIKISGSFAIFSFNATKTIAGGEGGLLLVNNEKYFDLINRIIFLNEKKFNYSPFLMSDIQATLILNQLKKSGHFIKKRSEIAEIYYEKINKEFINFTFNLTDFWNVFRLPLALNKSNERFLEKIIHKLENSKIVARKPVTPLIADFLQKKSVNYEISNLLYNSTFSLPLYPSLKISEAKFIIKETNKIMEKL